MRGPLAPYRAAAEDPAVMGLRTLDEVERDHILAVCERCGWRINGMGSAAERLSVNPTTFRSGMQKLG